MAAVANAAHSYMDFADSGAALIAEDNQLVATTDSLGVVPSYVSFWGDNDGVV